MGDTQRQLTRKLSEHHREQKAAKEERNRLRAESIRNRERAALEKRERQRQEKEMRLQQQYIRRVQEEAQRQQEAEHLVLLMEKEEAELIDRLRKTQNLQRQAYDQLKSTL